MYFRYHVLALLLDRLSISFLIRNATFIIFLFLLGLTVDGYFLFKRSKGVSLLQRSPRSPPAWQIGDIFKILILGITASYIFFIVFGAVVGFFESFTKTKFEFYKAENFRMIFDTIILDVAIFLVILGFLRKVYGKKLSSLGFAKKGMARNIFYGAAGYAGIIPIVIIIGIFVYIILNLLRIKPPPQPIVGFFLAEKNVALIFISGAIAAIIGPVIEEIFFRGIMYNAVKKKLGVFRSILITSVLFSFLHTHAASFFLVGFVPIAILGAALAYLYEKTGSLIPSITLHVLNNVGSVITVFAFRYFNNLVQ